MSTATLTGRRAATREVITTRRRVVSYERVSNDRGDATSAAATKWGVVDRAVERQAEDAHDAAALHDLGKVDAHYVDSGQSASEYRAKERDRWTDLLADIATGEIGWVLVWVLDRIIRDMDDLQTLLRVCKQHGVMILQTYSGTVINPHDPDSVMVAQFQGAVAANAAAKTSMRQLRKKASMAEKGVPHGGRRRFGYLDGMAEEHPGEAPIVRDLVSRFLAGESLRSLAAWLNDNHVPTVSTEYRIAATARDGKPRPAATWSGPNLRDLLAGPHLAGLRVHHGAVIGEGKWPALIPVETHDHVVAMLNNPARRPKGSGNARKWLLSGLMVCDECGAPCRAKPEAITAKGRTVPASYYCVTGRHAHRRIDRVDDLVVDLIVERLTMHDTAGLFTDDEAAGELSRLREARAAVATRLEEYAEAAADMSPAAYAKATNRIERELDALDVAIIEATTQVRQASRVLKGATGPGAAEAWEGWTLSRRRAIIAELAEVRLRGGRHNVTPTGTRFNPDDVVVNWR